MLPIEEIAVSSFSSTYHRFVNTTPKPKATKKRRGELVGPPPPPPVLDVVGAGGAEEVALGADIVDEGVPGLDQF